jgi:hypothetical protein
MMRPLLNRLLFFPTRGLPSAPGAGAGGAFEEHVFHAADGVRLHGWWLRAPRSRAGHVLLCHGNGGNIADRVPHASILAGAGFDVFLFDYRGYGRSAGRPSEEGTYADARAAREALLAIEGVDHARVLYLGESLGGAVALKLALEHPPCGLVLQSTFTGIRDMARRHYPVLPRHLVPDAYPSLRLVPKLRAPLLILHGDRDQIVPVENATALFEAAREPKQLHILSGVGHNDLLAGAASEWANTIAAWAARHAGVAA